MDTPRGLRRRHSVRLTLRGGVVLLAGVAAIVLAYPAQRRELLVVGAAAVLLVLVGLAYLRLRRPRFEVERSFDPPIAVAGGSVEVTLRVRNRAPSRSPAVRWNDVVPWHDDIPPATLAPIGSGSARRREVGYRAHPPRRGHYALGPFVAEFGDPFGLARAVIAIGEPERLVVTPDLVDLAADGPLLAEGDGVAHLVHRRATGNEDDLTTREYRRGDAMRRVHWRASARHGELMVRQEEQRSNPDVRILVDTRADGYADAEPDEGERWAATMVSERFEWVVRMVASLSVHLDADGFTVGVEESAEPQLEQLGPRWEGRRRLESFLTSLAGVHLADGARQRSATSAGDARGPAFAVLGDAEPETVDWVLRRRDPRDAGIAFVARSASGGAERRLRDAGWTVIAVDPEMSPAEAWLAVGRERELVHDD